MSESLVREYFTHSQLHGLRFVADFRRHWIERIFWFFCICVSWYGCFLLISSSWKSYVNNPLSFGAETTYINWNTSFFSVTVCENENTELIEDKAEEEQEQVDKLNEDTSEARLKMNLMKTKVMYNDFVDIMDLKLRDVSPEMEDEQMYLGKLTRRVNSFVPEIIRRIRLGWTAFGRNFQIEDEKRRTFFGDHDWNLNDIIKEISFFKGNAYTASEYCNLAEIGCPKTEIKEFALKFRSKCEEIFKSCSWMGTTLNCCKYFRLLETELGPCYSLNSIQVKKPKPIQLISNRITGPGALTIELFTPANVYIHSPEDVPFLNTIAAEMVEARKGTYNLLEYGITEIVNEPEVKRVDIARRRCRYPEENDLSVYNRYSYTACVTECRAKEQMKLCNCTSHFTPNAGKGSICNIDGLLCLDSKAQHLTFLINPWSTKTGLICSCLPGCAGTEFDLVKLTTSEINASYAVVTLTIDRLPSVKLKRSVVRSNMDLVVSMGGTVGLFVGASLLSFVEIIYFFTLRLYGTMRMRKEKKMSRMEHT